MDKQIMELNKRYARKKLMQRIVALLCVFVMLFTVNSLKMVAQTLTRKPMCGLKEHQHKEKCYDASGNLVCGKVEHQHTDACYQESPTLEIEDDSAIGGWNGSSDFFSARPNRLPNKLAISMPPNEKQRKAHQSV